jgi:hypothetical protein
MALMSGRTTLRGLGMADNDIGVYNCILGKFIMD